LSAPKESAANVKKIKMKTNSYKPLPDCLTIKESSIDGLGLFAAKYIYKDTVLGISHHYIKTPFSEELVRTPISGFCNHSTKPNCIIEECNDGKDGEWGYKSYNLIAIMNISPGDEITLDYTKELCGLSGYGDEEWLKESSAVNEITEEYIGAPGGVEKSITDDKFCCECKNIIPF
jgi:SET domain-containing protein